MVYVLPLYIVIIIIILTTKSFANPAQPLTTCQQKPTRLKEGEGCLMIIP